MAENIINSFQKGMHSGIDPSVFPVGSYREMRNGHIFSRDEHGFVVTNISAPAIAFTITQGYLPIGSCEFNGILYIISYNSTTNLIEIGEYGYHAGVFDYHPLPIIDDGIITTNPFRVSKTVIGYSTDQLVEMFARKSYDDSINLYICDGINANIVVNTGTTYINTISNPITVYDLSQFKSIGILPIMNGEVVTGGYLRPGNYFVAIRYTTNDLNSTIFLNQVGPFTISEGTTETNIRGMLNEDITLSRSIALTLSSMPADYKYYELAVFYYFGENGVTSFESYIIANKYTNTSIVIDGQEETMSVAIEDILKNNIEYSICKSHIQLQGRYYGVNWKSSQNTESDLTTLASLIIPYAVYKYSSTDDAIAAAHERNYGILNTQEMKYKAGEIYPFAVSFIIDGKYVTDAYPVCGYDSNMVVSGQQATPLQAFAEVKTNVQNAYVDYSSNKGLYRFPFAKNSGFSADAERRRNLFYNMIGIRFDFSLYKARLSSYNINITGVIIRQGERVENCLAQGLNLPLVDRVITIPQDKYYVGSTERYALQVIALGDGQTPVYFPYAFNKIKNRSAHVIAGSVNEEYVYQDEFSFPVIFFKGFTDHLDAAFNYIGYVSPYFSLSNFTAQHAITVSGSKITVRSSTTKEYFLYSENLTGDGVDYDNTVANANNMANIRNFAFMSPDNIYGANNISGIIRTLQRLDSTSYVTSSGIYNKNCFPVSCSIPSNAINRAIAVYVKNDGNSDSDYFTDATIEDDNVDMTFVDNAAIAPDENGYISQMKSIFEVFGEYNIDIADTDLVVDPDYYDNNILGKSRTDMVNAGIMLNNTLFNRGAQEKGWTYVHDAPYNYENEPEVYNIFEGYRYLLRDHTETNLTPRFITNMGLKSHPYHGFMTTKNVGEYNFNDFISEIYKFDPDSSTCYAQFVEDFNIMLEKYSEIELLNIIPDVTEDIYKGDVYAQVITFRLNHYTYDMKESGSYADDFRHGQVAQLYLEQFKNHALRCVTDYDIFYPYCSRVGQNLFDFAYYNSSDRYKEESSTYNEGYHERHGPMVKNGIDIRLPLQSNNKPNRCYWSDRYIDGSFEDAYRNIHAGNYRDFNPENGQIHKIVAHGSYLFIIQDKGISQLFLSNNPDTNDDSSSIIAGETGIISEQTRELAQYGTQHPQSIVVGENGVYGVDWRQRKIWFISLKVSDRGSYFFICEDLIETKSLRTFFSDMGITNTTQLENALYGDDDIFRGIVSGYDKEHNKIYFTFHLEDSIETLVYDESQNLFIGYYDYTPNIYIPYREKLFMFNKYDDQLIPGTVLNNIWAFEGGIDYDNFYQQTDPENQNSFKLVFYVNGLSDGKNLSNVQKEYIVHHLFASDNLLKNDTIDEWIRKVEWQTEYQHSNLDLSGTDPLTNDVNKIWKTPIFEDHMWHIPIDVQSSTLSGPGEQVIGQAFEPGASLRGSWLKVTITYSGNEKIYIKNCITDFINSYS